MTRICMVCERKADSLQHIFQRCQTNPEYYVRIPVCQNCHNMGRTTINCYADTIMNNIDKSPPVSLLEVNGTNLIAFAGSFVPNQTIKIPSNIILTSFKNKNTDSVNDFRVLPKIAHGSYDVNVSGGSFGNEYVAYVYMTL